MKKNEQKENILKEENSSYSSKKEGEMVTIKDMSKFLRWFALILIIGAGITLFYKNVLLTVIFLVTGGVIYVFTKEIAKMIKEAIG